MTWLLVSGAPRSGTSLLGQILNSHPNIACLHEYGLDSLAEKIEGLLKYSDQELPRYAPSEVTSAEAKSIDEFCKQREQTAGLVAGETYLTPRREHLERLIESFYDVVSGKHDLVIRADKTPNIAYHDRRLDSISLRYGKIKRLLIARNPLDVISSSMRRAHMAAAGHEVWRIKTITDAIVEWRDNWDYLVNEFRQDQFDMHILKYEDLLHDFGGESRKLASFLGVENRFRSLAAPVPDHLRDFKLSEAQNAEVLDTLGPIIHLWDEIPLPDLIKRDPPVAFALKLGRFEIGGNTDSVKYLRNGFSEDEPWGRWTIGHNAEIVFRAPTNTQSSTLRIELTPYTKRKPFDLVIKVNNQQESKHRIKSGVFRKYFDINIPIKNAESQVSVRLNMPVVKKKGDEPASDTREIGIGLKSFMLLTDG